jgi:hypothetical protein
MRNLFEGGIKGRLFNNPAGLREGGKKMKKGIVSVVALLGALILVGWGCGPRTVAPADTNSDTDIVSEGSSDSAPEVPAGWTEYRNERFGFSFQYPEGWERRENETSGEVLVSTSFDVENAENDNPITFTVSTGVSSPEDDAREFAAQGFDVIEVTTVTANGVEWRKTITKDRETPLQFIGYVAERGGKSYAFFSNYLGENPDGSVNQRNIDALTGMLNGFQFVE